MWDLQAEESAQSRRAARPATRVRRDHVSAAAGRTIGPVIAGQWHQITAGPWLHDLGAGQRARQRARRLVRPRVRRRHAFVRVGPRKAACCVDNRPGAVGPRPRPTFSGLVPPWSTLAPVLGSWEVAPPAQAGSPGGVVSSSPPATGVAARVTGSESLFTIGWLKQGRHACAARIVCLGSASAYNVSAALTGFAVLFAPPALRVKPHATAGSILPS